MSDYYPRMLYRFVGEPDEEYIIVTTQGAEDRKRRAGFHHYNEPNPPRKGGKAKEVQNEDASVEGAPGDSGEETYSPEAQSSVSEALKGWQATQPAPPPGPTDQEPE